jgi:hypothetical protein
MENFLGEFTATADDGQTYRINIYHRQHPSEHDAGAAAPDAASMVLRTMIGQLLTRSAKGMYLIRETGVRLRSAAANAP